MRTLKVYVNVYDFTPANEYLSKLGIAGYHTGVQINNKEYCYCVISSDQDESGVIVIDPETADFKFSRKIYMGEVIVKNEEFLYILENLAGKYTCGKYHMFNHNCNHFTQDFVMQLLRVSIPKWIFRATNILGWVCCCLPVGLVSGQWALAALQNQSPDEMDDGLTDAI